MSAWIVSKEHIDVIVAAAMNLDPTLDPDELGTMLWNENFKSVSHQYEGRHDRPLPEYSFTPPPEMVKNNGKEQRITPVVVAKAIDCYEFQSCEHKEWEASKALEVCKQLKQALFPNRSLTDDEIRDLPGYNDAPWGISGG